ncbi:GntR family transcriptional regulator [Pseudoroseomonas deserti]|uniref:GntR family transcriptional regulator n=1 Tax=Teichococcus deserti TaxID=1817963 RepID=A0A1V2H2G2_9PROT|nr:PLP-dependent aminotransferase family protein [Pseudoroseomonas deserti]ONG51789.1 GntR family transcriptional regulator [Pseudoroseomonas deserti]
MTEELALTLDRAARQPLAEQIRLGIAAAIAEGRLRPGARMPSWRDLAAQLGVARGTVRVAYERLADSQLLVASGPAGTHVTDQPAASVTPAAPPEPPPLPGFPVEIGGPPAPFQMGVPAQDAFPFKLWSRVLARAARTAAAAPVSYPDPRGELALRQEISSYLALARAIACSPAQVFVTAGYAGGLGLALQALGLAGQKAWMEEPGYPLARAGLRLAGLQAVPVPVDAEGLQVEAGLARAPDAALALVTPGQQAPLGVTLSLARRRALLDWAAGQGAWIIEDDYLGELQLAGRAAPALAALDRAGRVIHAGSFSKTLSPALRLGFLVVPPALVPRFAEAALCLAPAPGAAPQLAVAALLRDGHALRHLRRMKRLYAARRQALRQALGGVEAGLSLLLPLPEAADDVALAREAGGGVVPLSAWYAGAPRRGLLLGVTNAAPGRIEAAAARLAGFRHLEQKFRFDRSSAMCFHAAAEQAAALRRGAPAEETPCPT